MRFQFQFLSLAMIHSGDSSLYKYVPIGYEQLVC